jgi:hypothetical protein
MVAKLKGFIVVLSIGVLIYFVSSANTLVAEDSEDERCGQFANAVVSVEARVVAVEPEVLEEIIGASDDISLDSVRLERIMQSVGEEEAELVSSVKLSMKNDTNAEIETESNEQGKVKNVTDEVTELESREIQVSFRATSHIIDLEKIEVSFDFKKILSKSNTGSTNEVEEQGEGIMTFEMSSTVVLRPGRPRIVGATMKDEAMFLIMSADI